MTRNILPEDRLHPAIQEKVAQNHRDIVEEVMAALAEHRTVVVGMTVNPSCKKARDLLEARGTPFKYLGYGGYTNNWRRRNALKMWTGWPTFPMCFHDGVLIGGYNHLKAFVEAGGIE
jgi:glutaredoxin-related protein